MTGPAAPNARLRPTRTFGGVRFRARYQTRSGPEPDAGRTVWEPAAGSGKMSRVLEGVAGTVISSDIAEGQDLLAADGFDGDAIITNPPYELAAEFPPIVREPP